MEIMRFGPGHRRLGGPPGTKNVEGQVIMHDDRAVISELAFGRYAMIAPHTNPDNTALFIVISGAGWVQVGDERSRVNHGEAVVWPAGDLHGAYTDGIEMRAIVVELSGAQPRYIEGVSRPAVTDGPVTPAQGSLAERQPNRDEYDSSEGEPW